MIIAVSIANHTIFGLLIGDESSYNILYIDMLVKLGLRQHDMDPCDDRSILTFNDFITHPCDVVDILLSLEKIEEKINVILHFLIVPCKSDFNIRIFRYKLI